MIADDHDYGSYILNATMLYLFLADDPILLINYALNASYLLTIMDRMYATTDGKAKFNIILSGLMLPLMTIRMLAQLLDNPLK